MVRRLAAAVVFGTAVAAVPTGAAAESYCAYALGFALCPELNRPIRDVGCIGVGYCAPGSNCTVNVGYCAPGGNCVVNVGYCDDTDLPVGV